MKKILFVCHTYTSGGGAEKVLSTLIEGLSTDYEITLIERLEGVIPSALPANVTKLPSMSFTNERPLELHKSVFGGKLWRYLLSVLIFLTPRLVYRRYIREQFDYEISFNYLYSASIIAHSINSASKKIMWNHGTLFDLDYQKYRGLKRFKYFMLYTLQKKAFSKAHRIVSISEDTAESIRFLFPKCQQKLYLIHNGYNFSAIEQSSNENGNVLPLKQRFRLVSIGRLDANKNVQLQVQAVKKILETSRKEVDLFVIGDGIEKETLKQLAGQFLEKNIFFLGYQKNPYGYLKTADALLMTSYSEGFPTVVVEALSLGIPVISTKVGGIKELIIDGDNGFIIENNVVSLTEAILEMADLQNRLEKEKIQKSVAGYSIAAWVKNVKKMMEDLK